MQPGLSAKIAVGTALLEMRILAMQASASRCLGMTAGGLLDGLKTGSPLHRLRCRRIVSIVFL